MDILKSWRYGFVFLKLCDKSRFLSKSVEKIMLNFQIFFTIFYKFFKGVKCCKRLGILANL